MALPSTITRSIFDAATKTFIAKHAAGNVRQRAEKWIRETGVTPEQYGFGSKTALLNAVQNVVRTAKESVELGSYITHTGYEVTAVPRVPAGPEWTNDYRYRVTVSVTDNVGLTKWGTFNLYSDRPIDYPTISNRAVALAHQEGQGPATLPGALMDDSMSGGGHIEVFVVSAGRR